MLLTPLKTGLGAYVRQHAWQVAPPFPPCFVGGYHEQPQDSGRQPNRESIRAGQQGQRTAIGKVEPVMQQISARPRQGDQSPEFNKARQKLNSRKRECEEEQDCTGNA